MKAKWKCLKCGYRWVSEPDTPVCPKCGHVYVKWLNYEEMRKKGVFEDGFKNDKM